MLKVDFSLAQGVLIMFRQDFLCSINKWHIRHTDVYQTIYSKVYTYKITLSQYNYQENKFFLGRLMVSFFNKKLHILYEFNYS